MNYSEDFIRIAEQLDSDMGGTVSIVAEVIGESSVSYGELSERQEQAFEQFIAENKEEILSRLFDLYRPIWDAFEEFGWRVNRYENTVEMENWSPAGEDLIVTLWLGDKQTIPEQLYEIYDDFDEEEHATMWLNAKQHGTKGIPSIWTLVKDAEEITEMYERLFTVAQEKYSLLEAN